MPDEMVTVTFEISARDAWRLPSIVDKWISEELLSDIAYERWRNNEAAIVDAVDDATSQRFRTASPATQKQSADRPAARLLRAKTEVDDGQR